MPGIMKNGVSGMGRDGVTNGDVTDGLSQSHEAVLKVNGLRDSQHGPLVNGATPSFPLPGQETTNPLQSLVGQLPPEIEHITFGMRSMPMLIERLAQETFNGLGEVINDLADIPVPQPQVNGVNNHVNNRVGGNGINDESQTNIRKKTRMFYFANSRRAQFIKVLVLSKWARQAEAVGKVIDLRVWLSQQLDAYGSAVTWIGEIKRNLAKLKKPSPDIKTALEVLSLGKASWIPDLGYLPAEEQTPRAMLDGLQRINALLSIRLNLHENIPPTLRDFSIASGRATFHIPGECEVDLSIFDEDFTIQLYFVDLRFTFSPTPTGLPAGRLRDDFEVRVNSLLGTEGLRGLFDYVHDLVLTQKLLILRDQASDMARNHWSEHIKVEPLRRAVVVQYWCDRPGAKSWIECGIKRGKQKLMAHSGEAQRTSEIGIRWFRAGIEVKDFTIDLRLERISMSYVLEQVIAKHTTLILSEIAVELRNAGIFSSGRLRLRETGHATNPYQATLLLQLTPSTAVKILKEPVSGRFALLPPSSLSRWAESQLNRSATSSADASHHLLLLRSFEAHEVIERFARRLGWESVRSFKPTKEFFQRLSLKTVLKASFYRRPSWHPSWLLAFLTSSDGDTWLAVETVGGEPLSATPTNGHSKAYSLPLPTTYSRPSQYSLASLTQVERAAVGVISQYLDTRHLAVSRIPHKMQPTTSTTSLQRLPSIYLRLQAKQAPPLLRSVGVPQPPWAHEVIRLDYRGLDSSHSSAIRTAVARVAPPTAAMKTFAARMSGASFDSRSRAFTLQLRTRVGETSIPQLKHRFTGIGRLHEYISTINDHNLVVKYSSMDSLTFKYHQGSEALEASIRFPEDGSVGLTMSSPNPHLRILDHLNRTLRQQGLSHMLALMSITLPLLTSLTSIERSHKSPNMTILSRSEQIYQIRYSAPAPKGGFDIQLKQRRDDPMWLIQERSIQKTEMVVEDEKWQQSLKELTRGKGNGWRGMNGGIVASISGITQMVEKLDDLFSTASRHTPEASRPAKRKAEDDVKEMS